ncbi:MAG: LamG-like jellyroll fold domain-containing protein [Pirellulaceae bacterium]
MAWLALLLSAALGQATVPDSPSVGQQRIISDVPDWRHISRGREIPSEGYADQPYIVKTDDGAWLCVMTTGPGVEGATGQHVVAMRSTDQGASWSEGVAIEPADGPEASYAVLLKVPGGRIYCFYNHNTDNVREVRREDQGVYRRVDSLGHYVFKYSDDHGRSWSAQRYDVPIREFACDRQNVYGGSLRFFWNVGRPLVRPDSAIMVLHKVGAMGPGFFSQSEGAFFQSRNILTESAAERITFETLPDGEIGLRTPVGGGRIAEEQSIVSLSDGSLYCVYRTVDGWPASAYSRDGGHTWSEPAYASYTPGGRRIKHPRAANFVWNCSNGKFLYWFHNHGGQAVRGMPKWDPYEDRNPAWLAAGREIETPTGRCIAWSQPEILLYDDDPFIRMSYPDLVEENGTFFITETQKHVARVHEIQPALLEGLFQQFDNRTVAADGLLLRAPGADPQPSEVSLPRFSEFHRRDTTASDYRSKDLRAGFSLDLWLECDGQPASDVLLDSRDESDRGIVLRTREKGRLQLTLHDGRQEVSWASDGGVIESGVLRHVVVIVDGGPKIITFVVDGILLDGGDERQFGWGRFSPTLRAPHGAPMLRVAPSVRSLRLYQRALRTSEAVGNFRAG